MTERSLRLFLPLVLLVTMLVVGAGSLAYALHQKQRDLTASERLNLLRDVAHLVRLADELPPGTSDLLAEEVAQVASRPQVQAVLLVTEVHSVPALVSVMMLPAVVLMASMFFTSIWFTFRDSFDDSEPAGVVATDDFAPH